MEARQPLEEQLAVFGSRRYTLDEWLALEEELDTRFEYEDGQLFDVRAMAGGSLQHGRACANATRHFGNALDGLSCFVYGAEVKIDVASSKAYYYPDASINGGTEDLGATNGSYTNPSVVIEVVSRSSYARDCVDKLQVYATIPTLLEYVLVFLHRPAVHVLSRHSTANPMTLHTYVGLETRLTVPSLSISVALSDLYRRVEFPEGASVLPHPRSPRNPAHEE